jgi:hypothetical protein
VHVFTVVVFIRVFIPGKPDMSVTKITETHREELLSANFELLTVVLMTFTFLALNLASIRIPCSKHFLEFHSKNSEFIRNELYINLSNECYVLN